MVERRDQPAILLRLDITARKLRAVGRCGREGA
jgi:hypothetical protein